MKITVIASSSAGNCYHISDGNSQILVECGIAWKKIQVALKFKTTKLDGILITHEHKDHSYSAKNAIRAGINVYCSKGTAEKIGISGHRVHRTIDGETIEVGGFLVKPIATVHDAAEPQAFFIKSPTGSKLLFMTDTAYCYHYKFTGITHLMVECNFSEKLLTDNIQAGLVDHARRERLLKSHFSLERVKDFLQKIDMSNLLSIHLMHLSDTNSNEAMFRSEIQKLTGLPVRICKR